jgi:Domain of unknown function (DUF6966)
MDATGPGRDDDAMDPDVARLADALDRLAGFLADHGEERWAAWVAADARQVRNGDPGGVSHFLQALGGMGSLNDLVFAPVNGNVRSEAEGRQLTEELRRMTSDAYRQASDLRASAE